MSGVPEDDRMSAVAGLEEAELRETAERGGVGVATSARLMAAYLVSGRGEDATLLWGRLPRELRAAGTATERMWRVAVAAIARDYGAALRELDASPWDGDAACAAAAAAAVRDWIGREAERVVAAAYSSLPVAECAAQLGVGERECVERAQAAGWRVDGDGFVYPEPRAAGTAAAGAGRNNERRLQSLVDFAAHLEEK